jgi:GNAT superfamily N-acetyltransferase
MAFETEDKGLDEEKLRSGVLAALNNETLGFYLLAEIDGRTTGQLMITTEWSDWRNAYFWWIQSVYVVPEFRRRGVYRALDRQVRQDAQAAGNVCGIRLYVERTNHRAQQVYVNLGMSRSHYDMYEVEFGE